MWQEKNMVRQYGQNKMKNVRDISVGAILYRHFYFLKVSPKQRPYEDAFQLYSYCNKERELPEQFGDWRHICTEQF